MLPNLNKASKIAIVLAISSFLALIQLKPASENVFAVHCPFEGTPEIFITNPVEGEVITGTKQITIDGEEPAIKVFISIRNDFTEPPWRDIYEGPPKNSYTWDSTIDSDGEYCLKAFAEFSPASMPEWKESQNVIVTVDNSAPSTPPPPQPKQPTNKETDSQQTTSQTEASPTTTDSTDEKKKKDDAGKVEEVIIEEEIPISISAFDPDIFLKGGDVSIKEITNLEKDGTTALYFSGKAKPNTLVTLYIFSNPVIVAVKSDAAGNWSYEREKSLDSGKHTAFATIYDEGVTRRSSVTEFYIAKSSGTGRSLILEKTTFQRFYPYALALGTAIIVAVLVVFMYRIYRKRKQANI
jgi:hypothetical protein